MGLVDVSSAIYSPVEPGVHVYARSTGLVYTGN